MLYTILNHKRSYYIKAWQHIMKKYIRVGNNADVIKVMCIVCVKMIISWKVFLFEFPYSVLYEGCQLVKCSLQLYWSSITWSYNSLAAGTDSSYLPGMRVLKLDLKMSLVEMMLKLCCYMVWSTRPPKGSRWQAADPHREVWTLSHNNRVLFLSHIVKATRINLILTCGFDIT